MSGPLRPPPGAANEEQRELARKYPVLSSFKHITGDDPELEKYIAASLAAASPPRVDYSAGYCGHLRPCKEHYCVRPEVRRACVHIEPAVGFPGCPAHRCLRAI